MSREGISLLFSIQHRTLINGRHRKNTRVKTAKLGSKTGRKMPVMYREVRIVREEIFRGIRAVWGGGGGV